MNLLCKTLVCFLLSVAGMSLWAQDSCKTTHYDERDGLSFNHVTQMVQDAEGFLWFSTWNGLDRFDGHEFVNFKPRAGDGCEMPSDRIRDIGILPGRPHEILCKVDGRWYAFSTLTGKFLEKRVVLSKAQEMEVWRSRAARFVHGNDSIRFRMTDRQGNQWFIMDRGVRKSTPVEAPLQMLFSNRHAEVKSTFVDRMGRCWVATKGDKAVRVYDRRMQLLGYLGADGRMSKDYVPFREAVYCIYESRDGVLWMGSKPGGLFRLTLRAGAYAITQYTKANSGLNCNDVYDIREDARGRIWLATMGGGINCLSGGHFSHYLYGEENRTRRIYLKSNVLLATTTEGLVTMDVNNGSRLYLNKKEARRKNSLSCSACMSVLAFGGKLYVATESGGVNELLSRGLLSSHLEFRCFDKTRGLASDVVLALANLGDRMLLVSSSQVMTLQPQTGETNYYGRHFFLRDCSFADVSPLRLPDGRWLVGLKDGVFVIHQREFSRERLVPALVLTGVVVENNAEEHSVNHLKRIVLGTDERSVMIKFAALDYRFPDNIQYAYRMEGDTDWHYIGYNRSVSLSELRPGRYVLQLRSTDSDGKWVDNRREVEIEVKPRFVETVWFQGLVFLFLVGLVAVAYCTYRYICRMKQQQRDTLDAYLALLETSKKGPSEVEKTAISSENHAPGHTLSAEDEAFMGRVMAFVEAHIADSDVRMDDMATALATSLSGLNRKIKSIVGLTPAEFLREARIKRACQMLKSSSRSVAEVAYDCGFSDPKYFGKCFRSSVGMSPSEYRNNG